MNEIDKILYEDSKRLLIEVIRLRKENQELNDKNKENEEKINKLLERIVRIS